MKKAAIVIVLMLGCLVSSTAQKPSLELTFTAIDSAAHIQLDSIKVMNRTQGGDTVLYYPDTVLILDYGVGVEEVDGKKGGLRVYQNYPNPVVESTTISIYIPEEGFTRCLITDIMGRVVYRYEEVLESGVHSFSYTPGGGQMSFFTVQWQNSRETIKMLHPNLTKSSSTLLSYLGVSSAPGYEYKASEALQGLPFALEDELLYIGYIDGMESGILDAPVVSDTFCFQFATNVPCPGTATVTYEGQVYNTIQIFSQCWLKENLNVGIMIDSLEDAEDNGIIEKYCFRNSVDNCDMYGGLYQWNELMQYTSEEGVQGICPSGWHIPTDDEWKVLEGAVDSYYGIGNSEWEIEELRGLDVGTKMKSSSGWYENGSGTDLYGFSALPGGGLDDERGFIAVYKTGAWWTSSIYYSTPWYRNLYYDYPSIDRRVWPFNSAFTLGLSVRCIKD